MCLIFLGRKLQAIFSTPQKCRNNKWRALEERKSIRRPSGKGSSSDSLQRSSLRKVGTMSRLQKNVSNLQQQQHRNPDQTQRAKEFSFSSLYTNNSFARGESSTQQQLYRRKLQVQPHYLSIGNPFNNSFLSTQSNVGGGLQQHGPLFGMVDSQGLKDPIIGSINNRPGLELNNRDHHTHNGYNLDLNAAYVTTYSGSAIMSGIHNGNATINELEAANANFQQYIGEPNMSDPTNIVVTSQASDTKGSDSNERKNYGANFDFNNIDYIFQNLGPPGADLPYEQGSAFDQV